MSCRFSGVEVEVEVEVAPQVQILSQQAGKIFKRLSPVEDCGVMGHPIDILLLYQLF